jgi:hypothetical protein
MLLQQPHGDPEIQHYEKFQQRINKKIESRIPKLIQK